jgi:tetratricopeptide (TPR) repeat protein
MLQLRAPAGWRREIHFFQKIHVVFAISVLAAAGLAYAGGWARIQGTVTDSKGSPIPNVVITITGDPANDFINFNKVVTVDKEGKFGALIHDATQRYVFHVSAEGYQQQERSFNVGPGSTPNKVYPVSSGYRASWNEFNFQLLSFAEASAPGRIEFIKQLLSFAEASAAGQIELVKQPGYKELEEAKNLYKARDTEGARAKFKEPVAAKPDLLPALSALAELNYDAGDMEGALAAAQMCLKQDDESVQCLAIAANASQALGDEEAHAAYVAQYEDLNPDVH